MLISLIFLLVSNAVTLRQDQSILFSRVVIKTLLFTSFLAFNNLFTQPLEKGIGIYGGLFNITTFTQTFNIAILLAITLFSFIGVPPLIVFFAKPGGFNLSDITINRALSSTISILTLLLILFIYTPGEWFNIVSILTLILFKA